MPIPETFQENYGVFPNPDKPGYIKVTPTEQRLGPDARFDRVYVYDPMGMITHTYLRDKLGIRFKDNLGYKDDPGYVETLPSREEEP